MEDFEVSSRDDLSNHHEANLPPVDRGKGAYMFLAACFMLEALIWGMISLNLGMRQGRYTNWIYLRFHFLIWNFPGLLQFS